MTRVLAVADEVAPVLYTERLTKIHPDLVLGCGDLPFDYLEYLVTVTNVPLLYVPGNHDADLDPRRQRVPAGELGKPFLSSYLEDPPGPRGCVNVDLDIAEAASLRVVGLGGSIRYSPGPNQYTQAEMSRRARRLRWRVAKKKMRHGGGVNILLTHSPPRGLGDGNDPAHQGFRALNNLIGALAPKLLVHGHVHPYGQVFHDRVVDGTTVVNAVPYRILEV